jgi:hypothetical protein
MIICDLRPRHAESSDGVSGIHVANERLLVSHGVG